MSNRIDAAGIGGTMLIMAMIAVALLMVKQALDLPEVNESHTTGKCVSVETPDGPGDCEALPEKYTVNLVQ